MKKHKQIFASYISRFFMRDPQLDAPLLLKQEHSEWVFANALMLVGKEPVFADAKLERAVLLGALYHDVGRFEQYTRWKTFADALSCNHGILSAKIIRQEGFLREEEKEVQGIVLFAVGGHNRLHMPSAAPERHRQVLAAVRDADKLDILRILRIHLAPKDDLGSKKDQSDAVILLHLEDNPKAFSLPILEALREKRLAKYGDMRFYNDFRLLLCTWLYDFYYKSSLRQVQKEGYLDEILSGLQDVPEAQSVAMEIVQTIFTKV